MFFDARNYSIYLLSHSLEYGLIFRVPSTVKPCPEAHMDMILFEVFLKSIDLIPQQQILQRHYFYYR